MICHSTSLLQHLPNAANDTVSSDGLEQQCKHGPEALTSGILNASL